MLVYRDGGFVTSWRDGEPFAEASRVLYVALTRARIRVTVLLSPAPHPLIAPFSAFAQGGNGDDVINLDEIDVNQDLGEDF